MIDLELSNADATYVAHTLENVASDARATAKQCQSRVIELAYSLEQTDENMMPIDPIGCAEKLRQLAVKVERLIAEAEQAEYVASRARTLVAVEESD